jgi:hypothetical protein
MIRSGSEKLTRMSRSDGSWSLRPWPAGNHRAARRSIDMKRSEVRGWVLALAALGAAFSGCMLAPGNGSIVQQMSDPIAFSGFTAAAGARVKLEASTDSDGPFSTWQGSSTKASSVGIPWFSYTFYEWGLTSVIPADRWADFEVIPGCSMKRTFVRSRTGELPLITFDEPAGVAALKCMAKYGNDITAALTNCRSADSPVVSIEAKNVNQGDVTITSMADVQALRCVQVIHGSLTIPDSDLWDVSLPLLERVTGNVTLFVKSELASSGGANATFNVRTFTFPALTRIGGSLAYQQPDVPATTAGWQFSLGLEALTRLGGSLSIQFGIHGISVAGLTALTSVPGNLSISFTDADVQSNLLLPNLQTVGGDVSVSGGFTVLTVLGGLQHIGGNLQVQNACLGAACKIGPSLQDVAGVVTLDGAGHGAPLFGAMTAASGGLSLHAMSTTPIGTAGADTVQLGALTILDSPGWISLPNNWRLASTAPVTIHDTGLATADICTFLAAQPDYTSTPPPDLGGATCP